MLQPQSHFRWTPDADPSWCASVLKHPVRRAKLTHTVTMGKKSFRLCGTCARNWESVRGAKVEKINGERCQCYNDPCPYCGHPLGNHYAREVCHECSCITYWWGKACEIATSTGEAA